MNIEKKHFTPNELNYFLSMSQVLEHLEQAIEGAKELDSNNIVQDVEMWKKRALVAEDKIKALEEQMQSLLKENESLEIRCKRAEKVAIARGYDPIEELMTPTSPRGLNQSRRNSMYNSDRKFDDEPKEVDQDEETVTPDANEMKRLLGRKSESFRHKWNKTNISNRIKGIEMNEEESIGESTAAARKYLNGILDENDKMYIPRDVVILEQGRDDEASV
jgi:hypothetical protein